MSGNRIKLLRENKGLTLEELAELTGLSTSYIQRLETGARNLSMKHLPPLAHALGVAEHEILHEGSRTTTVSSETYVVPTGKRSINPERIDQQMGNAKIAGTVEGFGFIRVRGRPAAGAEGEMIFSHAEDDTVDFVDAPPKLTVIRDAYAVYVVGDSMVPRFESGEVAYVNPNLTLRKDDYVVVQTSTDGGDTIQGWVKRFISMDSNALKVSQLNPKKILTFPRKQVVAVHRIVFSGPA